MAGHSHWANIKHYKGAADAKRGKLWSKLSRLIIIASKAGGGDPVTNLKLRYAIDKARAISMPKDNIERAIRRGTGEAEGITYEELVYEGFGAGGTAIVVDLLTDNRNRSNGEIRKLFEKGGGNMGAPGCAAHFFDRKGVFVILAKGIDEDSLMSIVLDAGADDMQNDRGKFTVTCDPAAFQKVQEALGKNNIVCESAEITMVAKMNVDVDAETASKVTRLLETLDDNDDVQNVYCNMQMSPEVLAKLEKE
ncbi:MAG: YebC/PmpR family DNA-binding transcriptional regulator [Planctomycetes bacterium]|nr:YebC/PmpR family DNA-binding transcriptional regulator [Planctomycetota bacterium]